jgi:hypothetical protein
MPLLSLRYCGGWTLQDAVATDCVPLLPRGLGVRQPYAALASVHWHSELDWQQERGMVKLRLEQQESFSRAYPKAFAPVKGGWGRRGATRVHLESIDEPTLRLAITAA